MQIVDIYYTIILSQVSGRHQVHAQKNSQRNVNHCRGLLLDSGTVLLNACTWARQSIFSLNTYLSSDIAVRSLDKRKTHFLNAAYEAFFWQY